MVLVNFLTLFCIVHTAVGQLQHRSASNRTALENQQFIDRNVFPSQTNDLSPPVSQGHVLPSEATIVRDLNERSVPSDKLFHPSIDQVTEAKRHTNNVSTSFPNSSVSFPSSSHSLHDNVEHSNVHVNLKDPHRIPPMSPLGVWYWVVAALLVTFAGISSGLTVGLLSLDPLQLKVLEAEGTEEQKRGVRKVADVIRRHHLLLVTLLLANSVAMEALPIFLDRLLPSWAAVLLSVTAILLFGEIIPQALCTGPNQLSIARSAAPFVNILIGLLFVISWPIAKLLDFLLGDVDHHAYYARAHLKALIRMHERERRIKETLECGGLSDASSALGPDEVVVIEGALDLATKTAKEIMLPIDKVFMLDETTLLNKSTFELILNSGHSRVPVFSENRNNLKGFILTKSLLTVDSSQNIRAGDLIHSRRPIFANPLSNLYDLLNEFQKGHSHLAFVTNQVDEYNKLLKTEGTFSPSMFLMGIVTLEDVIEELIQEEIYDEFDFKQSSTKLNASSSGPEVLLRSASGLMIGESRKRSYVPIEGTTTDILCASPGIGSVRELPQIVRQLSQGNVIPEMTSSKKYSAFTSSTNAFPSSMTVPLVQQSSGKTAASTANGVGTPTFACSSVVNSTNRLLLEELDKARQGSAIKIHKPSITQSIFNS